MACVLAILVTSLLSWSVTYEEDSTCAWVDHVDHVVGGMRSTCQQHTSSIAHTFARAGDRNASASRRSGRALGGWIQVRCSVDVCGGRDTSIPVQASIQLLEQIRDAGDKDFTIQLFPTGNHGIVDAMTGYEDEFPLLRGFAPGYFDVMRDWLLAHVDVAR